MKLVFSGKTLVFTIFLFQKFRPSCNQFVTVKFFRLCAFDRVELRRALSIKGNRAPPLLAAGRVLHIDLENE